MLSSLAMALMERPRFPPCLLLPLVYSCLFLCFCLLFLYVYSCPSSDLTDFQAIFALSILPSLHTCALSFFAIALVCFVCFHSPSPLLYLFTSDEFHSTLALPFTFSPLPQNPFFISCPRIFFFALSLSRSPAFLCLRKRLSRPPLFTPDLNRVTCFTHEDPVTVTRPKASATLYSKIHLDV